jgi:putative ABC transport system ATP-binding protein
MQSLIQLSDIQKSYVMGEGERSVTTPVLRGVSLNIDQGEFVAIVGQSGSGKSTLMHILGFLDSATSGTYLFDGRNVTNYDEDELADIRSRKVGFVFQAFNLLPRTTALDNVRLPLIYQGIGLGEQKDRAREALIRVGLADRMTHNPNELSGGQQQRVAIARALITNSLLILADEPTGNLDTKSADEIMVLFKRLNSEGRTILLVTHSVEVAQIAKRIITIRDGQILSDEKNQSWTS